MQPGIDQLRLVWAAGQFVMPVAAGYRLARRIGRPPAALADAILIGYLIQYICVGLLGMLGLLTPVFLLVASAVLSGLLWFAASFVASIAAVEVWSRREKRQVLGICLGAMGMIGALVYSQRMYPPLATDALTYHLPAAVLWLQKGRIVLFRTWFFNPANTYSPLAGSMFIAWLFAPMGNDSLARFVQIGPWVLILLNLLVIVGKSAPGTAAALIAAAAVLSRPFISECILAKDDLFVAVFFLSAVAAIAPEKMNSKFGPARLGIAIGLMLATKYTALMMLPVLFLAVGTPLRDVWRGWSVALACVILLAGPWYLRNFVEFGNPLYPVRIFGLKGLMDPVRVPQLRSVAGLLNVITGTYYSLPAVIFGSLLVIWLVAVIRNFKNLGGDPQLRVLIVGTPLGTALFALFSPQAEVRFLLPVFVLMFALCGRAVGKTRTLFLAPALLFLSVCTCFSAGNAGQIVDLALWGIVIAVIGLLVHWLEIGVMRLRRPLVSLAVLVAVFSTTTYFWPGYLDDYRNSRLDAWQSTYPQKGPAWKFIDRNLPDDATIAYADQFMIYPLYGFNCRRKVFYVPVHSGDEFRPFVQTAGELQDDLNALATEAANEGADESTWKANLFASGAGYLAAEKTHFTPELTWANADPAHFKKLFEDPTAAVYQIINSNLR